MVKLSKRFVTKIRTDKSNGPIFLELSMCTTGHKFNLYFLQKKSLILKVPNCELLNCSDFHYFYTIKPFWAGDFGAKI